MVYRPLFEAITTYKRVLINQILNLIVLNLPDTILASERWCYIISSIFSSRSKLPHETIIRYKPMIDLIHGHLSSSFFIIQKGDSGSI